MPPQTIELKIQRQESPESKPYWEEFSIPYRPGMNVISVLQEIQRKPVNKKGEQTMPVSWDCNCLEEVCGACSMIINAVPRQACSALIDQLKQPIVLEPFSKFPVIRDLVVDRQAMFESLKRIKGWISIDGTYNLGTGPKVPEKVERWRYELSRCMTCGCCMEGCPQVNEHSEFMGPFIVAQVRLFNGHPTGAMNKDERLEALMGEGGIYDCGNAQNCEKVCPKEIPLINSIGVMGMEVTLGALRKLLLSDK